MFPLPLERVKSTFVYIDKENYSIVCLNYYLSCLFHFLFNNFCGFKWHCLPFNLSLILECQTISFKAFLLVVVLGLNIMWQLLYFQSILQCCFIIMDPQCLPMLSLLCILLLHKPVIGWLVIRNKNKKQKFYLQHFKTRNWFILFSLVYWLQLLAHVIVLTPFLVTVAKFLTKRKSRRKGLFGLLDWRKTAHQGGGNVTGAWVTTGSRERWLSMLSQLPFPTLI